LCWILLLVTKEFMLFLMKNIKLHQNISTLAAFFVQALEKANDVPPDLTRISRDFDRLSHLVQLFPIPSFSSSFSTSSFPASPSSVAQAEVPRPSPFERVILYCVSGFSCAPSANFKPSMPSKSHSATRNCVFEDDPKASW
jgi:hypothetical protein